MRKTWVIAVLIACLVAGCGEGGEKVLQDLIDLSEGIGVVLKDIQKIDAILNERDVDDLQDAAELHAAADADPFGSDDGIIAPAPELFEDEALADSCCTPDGECPMGVSGAPVGEPCECILGDLMFSGSTCSVL